MNISKYKDKTFPAGKTMKELGLDPTRKFVVVEAGHPRFDVGTVLHFLACEESMCPIFVADDERKHARPIGLSYLAYLDEEDDVEKKEYVPRKGDKIRLEFEVVSTAEYHPMLGEDVIDIQLDEDTSYSIREGTLMKHATLISRAPRTLTKAEAEKMLSEKLGEEVTIE